MDKFLTKAPIGRQLYAALVRRYKEEHDFWNPGKNAGRQASATYYIAIKRLSESKMIRL